MRPKSFFAALLATLFFMSVVSVFGQSVKVYQGPSTGVTDAHLVPKVGKGTYAYAKYTFEGTLQDGTTVYWSARLHNFPMEKGQVEIKSRVRLKGEKKSRSTKRDMSKGEYTLQKSPIRALFGDHVMSGNVQEIRVQAKGDGYAFDLTFTPWVEGWRPGDGKVRFPDGTDFDTSLLQPKSHIVGDLIVDGESRKVSGNGYATYTRSTTAPHDQAKRFVEFRSIDGKTVIWMKEFITSKKFGEVRAAYLLVAHKGKIVVSSTDFDLQYGGWQEDKTSKNRYQVPTTVLIRAQDGESAITLAIKTSQLRKRTDYLAHLSTIERAVAGRFAQPINYAYTARFELKSTGARAFTAKGSGAVYEVVHLNP